MAEIVSAESAGLKNSFSRKTELVTRDIGGETIIVPICRQVGDLDSIYTLNGAGAMIWDLVDGQRDVEQMVEAVCKRYDVSPEEAREDVFGFLHEMEAAGLIQPGAPDEIGRGGA
jgi:hypothetical protein